MNDTSADIEQRQFEMMMKLGAQMRITLACEMYLAARASVLAKIPASLSEVERRLLFIEKMYGTEFSRGFYDDTIDV